MNLFQSFPKLARLARECVITEKLDGTNAQIYIVEPDTLECEAYEACMQTEPLERVGPYFIYAGSRTRLITPGKTTDNYGFAAWVHQNAEDLAWLLGPGRHFGEWWGQGIQRNYGINEKRFSLFHTNGIIAKPDCVSVVPELYRGPFQTTQVDVALCHLKNEGSVAAPGFMNPEGVVVYHEHAKVAFKKTFDDRHKEST